MIPASGKDRLRKEALGQRGALAPEFRVLYSDQIVDRILPFSDRMGSGPLGGFWPIRTEIDPRPSLAALASKGFATALPVVTGAELVFRRWQDDDHLREGPFGLREPEDTAPEVFPTALLVPLAAFDRRGHRIGYGAGFYDRAIAKLSALGPLLTIGIGFSVQEITQVPDEPHDRTLDAIVTELETIHIRPSLPL